MYFFKEKQLWADLGKMQLLGVFGALDRKGLGARDL